MASRRRNTHPTKCIGGRLAPAPKFYPTGDANGRLAPGREEEEVLLSARVLLVMCTCRPDCLVLGVHSVGRGELAVIRPSRGPVLLRRRRTRSRLGRVGTMRRPALP